MIFRIRDVRKYEQCPKKFYLSKKQETKGFPFVHFAYSLEELAVQYLKLAPEELFTGRTGQTTQETLTGFADRTWLMRGRFEAKQLRAKISFLQKVTEPCTLHAMYEEGNWLVVDYMVLCKTNFPKEEEGRRIALEIWLLKECGIAVRNLQMLHLNSTYVFEEKLDPSQLFGISQTVFKDNNKAGKELWAVVEKYYHDVTETLLAMEAILQQDHVMMPYHLNCTKHGKCEFYETCFEEDALPDDSILFLSQSRKKYEMLEQGISSMTQLNLDELQASYLQYAQYQTARTKQVYVDYAALGHWLGKLEHPFSFIDFEWELIGVPLYHGMKPYDVLPFQYSLHYEEHGKIVHREFLSAKDCRRDFIESLLAQMPSTGSIIAYHAEGAEKLRLKELAEQFPEYAPALMKLCDRMVDLTYPFLNGVVYHPQMRGTYSLKKLLEVIEPDHNYQELEINHGLQAVQVHRMLPEMSFAEQQEAILNLKRYCAMDTYAMVVVMRYLNQLLEGHQA